MLLDLDYSMCYKYKLWEKFLFIIWMLIFDCDINIL